MYQDNTNHGKLLHISATSSSRMKDDYTSSRMQDIYITCYYVATVLLLLRRRYREQVFTQELPLMEMEVAEELPLNMGMEVVKELPLNMEVKVTMEPWRGKKRSKEATQLHNTVQLYSAACCNRLPRVRTL